MKVRADSVIRLLVMGLETKCGNVAFLVEGYEERRDRLKREVDENTLRTAFVVTASHCGLEPQEFQTCVSSIMRCKSSQDFVEILIRLAWIKSGKRYEFCNDAQLQLIESSALGLVFNEICEELAEAEPVTISAPQTEALSHGIQVISDRIFAVWGSQLTSPTFIHALSRRLMAMHESEQADFLNEVMNAVIRDPPRNISDFEMILHRFHPEAKAWNVN